MKRWLFAACIALGFVVGVTAQEPGTKLPSVIMAPVGKVQVKAGSSTTVEMAFRVGEGFHINSSKPKSELLIPTTLKLNLPQQLNLTELRYPVGRDQTFEFSPQEKLNVYSGDFSISSTLQATRGTPPGTYQVSGELKYQACDRSACYPPRSLPVQFQVTVIN